MEYLEIGLFIGGIICAILVFFFNKIFNTKFLKSNNLFKKFFDDNNNKSFEKLVEADLKIQQTLTELRISTGSSRAKLFLFHNGGKFASNTPISKCSCTHESHGMAISPSISNSQNILLSSVPDGLEKALNPNLEIYKVSDLNEGTFKNYLLGLTVEAFSCDSLKFNGIIVGFVSIHWMKRDFENKDFKDVQNLYLHKIQEIKPFLENELDHKFRAFR